MFQVFVGIMLNVLDKKIHSIAQELQAKSSRGANNRKALIQKFLKKHFINMMCKTIIYQNKNYSIMRNSYCAHNEVITIEHKTSRMMDIWVPYTCFSSSLAQQPLSVKDCLYSLVK